MRAIQPFVDLHVGQNAYNIVLIDGHVYQTCQSNPEVYFYTLSHNIVRLYLDWDGCAKGKTKQLLGSHGMNIAGNVGFPWHEHGFHMISWRFRRVSHFFSQGIHKLFEGCIHPQGTSAIGPQIS